MYFKQEIIMTVVVGQKSWQEKKQRTCSNWEQNKEIREGV